MVKTSTFERVNYDLTMKVSCLKILVLLFVSCLASQYVMAQSPQFIYIQTDNSQPFYVKVDNRVLNSSSTGYIIIARLIGENYPLTIGFPDNGSPVLKVTVRVKDAGSGYLLKRSGDRDWTMLNLQNMKPLTLEKQYAPVKEAEKIIAKDEFARILSEVVDDPTIGRELVIQQGDNAVKTIEAKITTATVLPDNKQAPVVKTSSAAGGTKIEKLAKDSTADGLLISYHDVGNHDTVKILVPVSKQTAIVLPDTVSKKATVAKTEPKFIDVELKDAGAKTDSATNAERVLAGKENAGAGRSAVNADCKRSATQNDFLKLRKAMAAEANEKSMTKAAIKQFVTMCFTTEQVKYLGAIFITEEEKYKFFVAAYPHVWDMGNYQGLEDQLKDSYYKNRFKAMFSH
jgi:hypothetical protein